MAYSRRKLAGRPFTWGKEIIYIGMTNAASGLGGRLRKFDCTISGKMGHGGGDRVRFKYRDYDALTQSLYVAVAPFECDVEAIDPKNLRQMGQVARFEYMCLAFYVERFGELPEFNDKRKSPKYSAMVGCKDE